MVWECILWEEVMNAVKIVERRDKELYIQIMEENLQASLKYYAKYSVNVTLSKTTSASVLARRLTNALKSMNSMSGDDTSVYTSGR